MNSVAVDGSYETENVDNGKVKTEKTPAQQEPAREECTLFPRPVQFLIAFNQKLDGGKAWEQG